MPSISAHAETIVRHHADVTGRSVANIIALLGCSDATNPPRLFVAFLGAPMREITGWRHAAGYAPGTVYELISGTDRAPLGAWYAADILPVFAMFHAEGLAKLRHPSALA